MGTGEADGVTDPIQQKRVARNEARFRDVNEQMRARVDEFDGGVTDYVMMCECAGQQCTSMIEISRDAYGGVRSRPTWFIVCEGHVVEGAEIVVERHPRYWVVEKIGHGRKVAIESS